MPKTEQKSVRIPVDIAYDQKTDRFSTLVLPHPLSICYKVTLGCNYSCPHCIASSNEKADYGLDTEKAREVLKKIKESGITRVDITGGEPYMREDMDELLRYAVDLGLEVVITTNGSLLTDKNIQTLSELQIMVQTSIDGPKDINDKLRSSGSFQHSVDLIKRLQKANVPVRINTVIQKRNKNIIPEMISLAESLDVKNLYVILVCAQGRVYGNEEVFCLSENEEAEIRSEILRYRKESQVNVKMLDFKVYERACTLIDANGDFISQGWSEDNCINLGNILDQDLNELWVAAAISGDFDHALHLMQYLRHPMLYK